MRDLSTERLVLEPLNEAHAPEMFRVMVDPIIYTFMHERPPFTEEELRARYRFLEKRRSPDGRAEWLSWVARDLEGDAIGYLLVEYFPRGVAGVSVALAPGAWRKGLAREAVAAVIQEVIRQRGASRFFAAVAPRNESARRLFEKLGFRPVDRADFDLRAVDEGDLILSLGRGEGNLLA